MLDISIRRRNDAKNVIRNTPPCWYPFGYQGSVYSFDLVGPNFDATLTLDLDPHPLGLAVSIVSLLTFVPAAWRPSTAHPPSLPACPPARQNDICYIEFLIILFIIILFRLHVE